MTKHYSELSKEHRYIIFNILHKTENFGEDFENEKEREAYFMGLDDAITALDDMLYNLEKAENK